MTPIGRLCGEVAEWYSVPAIVEEVLFLSGGKAFRCDEDSVEPLEMFEAWRRGLGVVAVCFPFRVDRTWWWDILHQL